MQSHRTFTSLSADNRAVADATLRLYNGSLHAEYNSRGYANYAVESCRRIDMIMSPAIRALRFYFKHRILDREPP